MHFRSLMSFSKALLALPLILSAVSCTSLNPSNPFETENEFSVADSGYINLELPRITAINLREGVDPLKKIERISLVFYDTNGSLCFVKDIHVDNSSPEISQRIKIPIASYKVLAIANSKSFCDPAKPLADFTAPLKAKLERILTLSDLLTDETASEVEVLSIPMFNTQGVVPITESQIAVDPDAEPFTLKIEVEPIVARVLVAGTPSFSGGSQVEGDKPVYLIDNVPSSIFTMRRLAKLASGVDEVLGDASSPSDRYALSATEFNVLDNPTDSPSLHIGNHKNMIYSAPIAPTFAESDILSVNVYAKEITVAPSHHYSAYIPRVVVRYRYTPNGIPNVNVGDSWVTFKGLYMSQAKFESYVANPSSAPVQLREAILKLKEAVDPISYTEGFSHFGIKFYYKSECYYPIWIRHFDDSKAPNMDSYGRYGLVRNNEYRIKINSISAAGEPIIPITSATEAVVNQQFLNSGIEVTQFVTHEQDEDL